MITATLTALLVEFNDIASVILNRPDKKDAMSFIMMQERIKVAMQIKSVILVGGHHRFCTDIDLNLTHSKQKIKLLWKFIKCRQSIFQKTVKKQQRSLCFISTLDSIAHYASH